MGPQMHDMKEESLRSTVKRTHSALAKIALQALKATSWTEVEDEKAKSQRQNWLHNLYT